MRINSSDTVVSSRHPSSGRRRFLGQACGAAIATVVASTTDLRTLGPPGTEVAEAAGSPSRHSRIEQAYEMREEAARYQEGLPAPNNFTNGDEELYPNKIASYTKGLQHDELGRVVPATYTEFVSALESGEFARIEKLQLG